ncbi:formylglycine-generating enzyme family protein [Bremerella cremea]|uniref:formylglycine-generating enzyme family protein n=1 Tax=Bremerella cremea TaxID=1031537 RepID=UPI0031EC3013
MNRVTFSTLLLLLLVETVRAETVGVQAERPEKGPCVAIEGGYMVPYEIALPTSNSVITMIPVPGGTVRLGSPRSEFGHTPAEWPEVEVRVAPFWIAETETTWGQYGAFQDLERQFRDQGFDRDLLEKLSVQAITSPTMIYDPSLVYVHGTDERLPATMLTNFAARQYTKWISRLTQHTYRLPSEAEWEYAAAAGAETAYHFGDDPQQLADYGWFVDNSDESPHFVKQKKPNAFGLYDMHGNVWEWVLDQYSSEGYQRLAGQRPTALQSVLWPTQIDPLMRKGGSWDDGAALCRLAAKLGSDDEGWKSEDPMFTLSPHWYTDYPGDCIGFRVMRPLRDVPPIEAAKYYLPDIPQLKQDVEDQLEERRAVQGFVEPDLSAVK